MPASATTSTPPASSAWSALLAEADLIYVIGSKRAFPVTAYISLALSQQGVRNVLVDNVGSDRPRPDRLRRPARRGARRQLQPLQLDHARPRRDRRASAAPASPSITDSTFSPLVPLSDACVEVVESDFAGFRSLAATLAVGMALVQAVAARRAARLTGGKLRSMVAGNRNDVPGRRRPR